MCELLLSQDLSEWMEKVLKRNPRSEKNVQAMAWILKNVTHKSTSDSVRLTQLAIDLLKETYSGQVVIDCSLALASLTSRSNTLSLIIEQAPFNIWVVLVFLLEEQRRDSTLVALKLIGGLAL